MTIINRRSITEAIMNRIIHNSYNIFIDGKVSMCKRYGIESAGKDGNPTYWKTVTPRAWIVPTRKTNRGSASRNLNRMKVPRRWMMTNGRPYAGRLHPGTVFMSIRAPDMSVLSEFTHLLHSLMSTACTASRIQQRRAGRKRNGEHMSRIIFDEDDPEEMREMSETKEHTPQIKSKKIISTG